MMPVMSLTRKESRLLRREFDHYLQHNGYPEWAVDIRRRLLSPSGLTVNQIEVTRYQAMELARLLHALREGASERLAGLLRP